MQKVKQEHNSQGVEERHNEEQSDESGDEGREHEGEVPQCVDSIVVDDSDSHEHVDHREEEQHDH